MKMFRTTAHTFDIEWWEVKKATKTMVVLPDGTKQHIVGTGHTWHVSWEEAYRCLWKRVKHNLDFAKAQLGRAQDEYEVVKNIRTWEVKDMR
jgi:hypothetical protein